MLINTSSKQFDEESRRSTNYDSTEGDEECYCYSPRASSSEMTSIHFSKSFRHTRSSRKLPICIMLLFSGIFIHVTSSVPISFNCQIVNTTGLNTASVQPACPRSNNDFLSDIIYGIDTHRPPGISVHMIGSTLWDKIPLDLLNSLIVPQSPNHDEQVQESGVIQALFSKFSKSVEVELNSIREMHPATTALMSIFSSRENNNIAVYPLCAPSSSKALIPLSPETIPSCEQTWYSHGVETAADLIDIIILDRHLKNQNYLQCHFEDQQPLLQCSLSDDEAVIIAVCPSKSIQFDYISEWSTYLENTYYYNIVDTMKGHSIIFLVPKSDHKRFRRLPLNSILFYLMVMTLVFKLCDGSEDANTRDVMPSGERTSQPIYSPRTDNLVEDTNVLTKSDTGGSNAYCQDIDIMDSQEGKYLYNHNDRVHLESDAHNVKAALGVCVEEAPPHGLVSVHLQS